MGISSRDWPFIKSVRAGVGCDVHKARSIACRQLRQPRAAAAGRAIILNLVWRSVHHEPGCPMAPEGSVKRNGVECCQVELESILRSCREPRGEQNGRVHIRDPLLARRHVTDSLSRAIARDAVRPSAASLSVSLARRENSGAHALALCAPDFHSSISILIVCLY